MLHKKIMQQKLNTCYTFRMAVFILIYVSLSLTRLCLCVFSSLGKRQKKHTFSSCCCAPFLFRKEIINICLCCMRFSVFVCRLALVASLRPRLQYQHYTGYPFSLSLLGLAYMCAYFYAHFFFFHFFCCVVIYCLNRHSAPDI